MKKYLLIFFFSVIIIFATEETQSKTENFIIAKVGQKIITNFDVKNKIIVNLIISKEEINQENINNLKAQVLNNLTILRLKEIELENYNFEASKEQVDAFLNRLSSNDIGNLKNDFEKKNLDFNTFVKEIETEIKWRQFIYKSYSNKIKIDEKSLEEEIEKIVKSNSSNKKEVNLSEIVILQSDNSEENMSRILKEIKINGFENTALKFSITNSASNKGSLGWINIDALSDKIKNIVLSMEINQVSEPIIDANSILYLKLNERRSSYKDIDKIKLKNSLMQQKQNEMFNLYSNSHLSKLKNNNFIQYK